MKFACLLAMAAFALSLYGWGWGFRRLSSMPRGVWPVTLALGLGVTIFLGGILNAVALAYAPALGLIALGGLALAFQAWRERPLCLAVLRRHFAQHRRSILAVAIPAVAVLAFAIATQLPPGAYNYRDDFEKYFFYPIAMLQTGTMSGSPLSAIGIETLGGKALLDGFVLTLFPIRYLNAADAVFGLFLCLMLAGSFSHGRRSLTATSVLCVLTVVILDPQYANISAHYLGAALIMAAVALAAHRREEPVNPVATGLIYAALAAMKPTFILFAALLWLFTAVALALHTRSAAKSLRWAALSAAAGTVFLLPWLVPNAGHYFVALTAPAVMPEAPVIEGSNDLFSLLPYPDGTRIIQYTAAVIAAVLTAAATPRFARRAEGGMRLTAAMTFAAGAALLAAYLLIMAVISPQIMDDTAGMRYFMPFAIGIIPAVCGLAAFHIDATNAIFSNRMKILLPLAFCLLPASIFLPSFGRRAVQAVDDGHILAFPDYARRTAYLDYNRAVFDGTMRKQVEKWQAAVPAGEPIIAWINTPFYFDFERNPIVETDLAGLAAPWAKLPEGGYIVWEYNGAASRSFPADVKNIMVLCSYDWRQFAQGVAYSRKLRELANGNVIVFDDGHTVIFRLPGPAS